MEWAISLLMLFLRLANIAVAAYLLAIVYSVHRSNKGGSFSKMIKTMLFAILLFFLVEFMQVFSIIPAQYTESIQSLFAFVFLLLLIASMLEVRKGMSAHDHLMRRKHKQRLVDVE